MIPIFLLFEKGSSEHSQAAANPFLASHFVSRSRASVVFSVVFRFWGSCFRLCTAENRALRIALVALWPQPHIATLSATNSITGTLRSIGVDPTVRVSPIEKR